MINIILSVNVIIFLFLGNFILNQRKNILSLEEKYTGLEKNLAQMIKDHPILVNADLQFAKQLREINRQLVSMDNQLQDLENKRDNDGGYQHALHILEMGGNKEEIIDSCHLSSAEAELLMNLQAYRSAINAT
jgi:septal ring factor EnvC (AmiA/AmiB activator)